MGSFKESMGNFKIGETVVCINARKRWYKLGGLKENEMYTVTGFNPYDGGLILKEVKSKRSGFNAYAADRFRKIDYLFVKQVIEKIQPVDIETETETMPSHKLHY